MSKDVLFEATRFIEKNPGVCLTTSEMAFVGKAIAAHSSCNLLVFGMGNDSKFWCNLNEIGQTTFIEDQAAWIQKIGAKLPIYERVDVVRVKYNTRCSQWESIISNPEKLAIRLPPKVADIKWDIIFIDGPLGNIKPGNDPAGRMSSIYMASVLIANGGLVFVHDHQRQIENAYSKKYLVNMVDIHKGGYKGGKGELACYKVKNK